MTASISLSHSGKFIVKSDTPLKGRGVKFLKMTGITNRYKYLMTQSACNKVANQCQWENVAN